MSKCKECIHCVEIANTKETGSAICNYPMSYMPVDINDECHFAPHPYTCKDCDRFNNDTACMTASANDPVMQSYGMCGGFIDKQYVNVLNAFYDWKSRGIDINQKLNDIMQEFADEYEEPFQPKGE